MATWSTINMQDAASSIMEQLIMFHDHMMMILIMITTTITYIMYNIITNKMINRFLMENQTIELVWTMLPAVMLIFIAMPSLRILYFMDEVMNPMMTIKAIGHQWYWSHAQYIQKTIFFSEIRSVNMPISISTKFSLMTAETSYFEMDRKCVYFEFSTEFELKMTEIQFFGQFTLTFCSFVDNNGEKIWAQKISDWLCTFKLYFNAFSIIYMVKMKCIKNMSIMSSKIQVSC